MSHLLLFSASAYFPAIVQHEDSDRMHGYDISNQTAKCEGWVVFFFKATLNGHSGQIIQPEQSGTMFAVTLRSEKIK